MRETGASETKKYTLVNKGTLTKICHCLINPWKPDMTCGISSLNSRFRKQIPFEYAINSIFVIKETTYLWRPIEPTTFQTMTLALGPWQIMILLVLFLFAALVIGLVVYLVRRKK